MNRDDIILLARKAGLWVLDTGEPYDGLSAVNFERFADLVAAAEREACAQVADSMTKASFLGAVGAAIRARGAA